MDQRAGVSPGVRDAGALRTAISDALVALHREQFGRGPERTRTVIGGDVVTVVLEGVLTSSEVSLIGGGDSDAVAESRALLQKSGAASFIEAIERLTGRRVREFVSGMNPEHGGTAVEVFLLEPS